MNFNSNIRVSKRTYRDERNTNYVIQTQSYKHDNEWYWVDSISCSDTKQLVETLKNVFGIECNIKDII